MSGGAKQEKSQLVWLIVVGAFHSWTLVAARHMQLYMSRCHPSHVTLICHAQNVFRLSEAQCVHLKTTDWCSLFITHGAFFWRTARWSGGGRGGGGGCKRHEMRCDKINENFWQWAKRAKYIFWLLFVVKLKPFSCFAITTSTINTPASHPLTLKCNSEFYLGGERERERERDKQTNKQENYQT